jgi:hypothetical protein
VGRHAAPARGRWRNWVSWVSSRPNRFASKAASLVACRLIMPKVTVLTVSK